VGTRTFENQLHAITLAKCNADGAQLALSGQNFPVYSATQPNFGEQEEGSLGGIGEAEFR